MPLKKNETKTRRLQKASRLSKGMLAASQKLQKYVLHFGIANLEKSDSKKLEGFYQGHLL